MSSSALPAGKSKAEHGGVAEGPSSTLAAALESAAVGWVLPSESQDDPANMREILAEAKTAKRRGPVSDDPTGDKTRCSWGSDATPSSLKQNSVSIAAAQQQEQVEQAQRKEAAEIEEFEAMFAALEVAERAEKVEAGSSKAPCAKKKPVSKKEQEMKKQLDSISKDLEKLAGSGRSRGRGEGGKAGGEGGKGKSRRQNDWNDRGWSEWWSSSTWWEHGSGESQAGATEGWGRSQRGDKTDASRSDENGPKKEEKANDSQTVIKSKERSQQRMAEDKQRRLDPADGAWRTFGELRKSCGRQYGKQELLDYWNDSMIQANTSVTVYLPKEVRGATVLEKRGNDQWWVTNEHLKGPPTGIAYRKTKSIEDIMAGVNGPGFDQNIEGKEEDDAWVSCVVEVVEVVGEKAA